MSEDEERRPEDGRADGEMVVEMSGARAEHGLGLAKGIEALLAEGLVGRLVVMGKVEVMLDERGAGISIVADTIAANPRIDERKGEEEKDDESALERARLDAQVSVHGSNDTRMPYNIVTQEVRLSAHRCELNSSQRNLLRATLLLCPA